jgi:histidyl-tRNA synthetase
MLKTRITVKKNNMSHKLQPVRGTHDILPEESLRRSFIEQTLVRVFSTYGYGQIATPIFEFSDVFHRTLGDTSDVVTKETYTFEDRGGESLTLRPEFTAAVVRAFISNGLQEKLPFKVYYNGPAFRYERPQKGRLRQFHQFGAELLGVEDALGDIEMIAMAQHGLQALGLKDHVKLEINSLGDSQSRTGYRTALVEYFSDHQANLSDDSKQRLQKNPLRILDSKDEGDKKIVAGAPSASDYFTTQATEFFAQVKEALEALHIHFYVNPRLVRGLDYYSHTVFEFTTEKLGAQGTVLAGGRYDGLVKLMGGPDVPGVGFAAGIERLLALIETVQVPGIDNVVRPLAVIPVDEPQEKEALMLTQELRHKGYAVELITRGNMSKKMKRAAKFNAYAALMLGEAEVASKQVQLKKLDDGSQSMVERSALAHVLAPYKI